jgi:hypothetical protein
MSEAEMDVQPEQPMSSEDKFFGIKTQKSRVSSSLKSLMKGLKKIVGRQRQRLRILLSVLTMMMKSLLDTATRYRSESTSFDTSSMKSAGSVKQQSVCGKKRYGSRSS